MTGNVYVIQYLPTLLLKLQVLVRILWWGGNLPRRDILSNRFLTTKNVFHRIHVNAFSLNIGVPDAHLKLMRFSIYAAPTMHEALVMRPNLEVELWVSCSESSRPSLCLFKFFNSFIELLFTHHTMRPLKGYNWVIFSIFTDAAAIPTVNVEHFYHLKRNLLPLSSHLPFDPSTPSWEATINLLCVSIDLPDLDIPCQWNYIVSGLFWLASFS